MSLKLWAHCCTSDLKPGVRNVPGGQAQGQDKVSCFRQDPGTDWLATAKTFPGTIWMFPLLMVNPRKDMDSVLVQFGEDGCSLE